MKDVVPEFKCSVRNPEPYATHGHSWESGPLWGVIIGVSRCVACGTLSMSKHFKLDNKETK